MEVKKSPKANLDKSKGLYLLIGLVTSLSVIFICLEWTKSDLKKYNDLSIVEEFEEEIDIQNTQQEEQQPVEPPKQETPVEVSEQIEIVDNSQKTEAIQIADADDNTAIEVGKVAAPPVEVKKEEDDDDQTVFVVAETMPEFPGGNAALMKYISENIKYPVIAQEQGIQGRVVCQFTVNKDGSVVDVEVARSSGDASLDKEAVRVIKSTPKWKPGKQRGKAVRVKYTVPVSFRLQ